MTMVEARLILKPLNIVIRKRHGEYRVAFRTPYRTEGSPPFDQEASAYYTNDLDDAVGTGIAMAKEGPQPARNSSAKG
jgi:hypothetical protein